jgi:spore germination protein YaaH
VKTITLDSLDRKQVKATVKSKASVKSQGKTLSRLVDKAQKDSEVIVIDEIQGKSWVKIRTENGKIGYIKTNKLENIRTVREAEIEKKQITGKVNMFWDYFSEYVQAPNMTGQTIEGINVVSPSFFYLDKENGKLKENVGDAGIAYIEWAHSNGYKVWPMVSNTEIGIDTTSKILNSYTKRQQLIQSIVDKCIQYDIDGINVDFENMYKADKDKFSRFIIELMPRMEEMGIVVSVDVTAPDGGENWSECYDRNLIGDVADYLVFMAYDQYGNSSTKPGTTAGFNWVETSLKKIIEYDEVDTEKIILGIPFYTRQWTVTSDGKIKDRSVISMINTKIPNNVKKQWDDTLKQYYIEYKSGKNTIKMWIEDGTSIKEKVSLVTKYNLGGTSAWRKDMETSNIWTIIREELQK